MIQLLILVFFLGVICTLFVQSWIWRKWFSQMPICDRPHKPQYSDFNVPQELIDAINDPQHKMKTPEKYVALNMLLAFLFQELKDTKRLRSFIMKKLNIEFAEMLQTAPGRLIDQITVCDFNLGGNSPRLSNVVLNEAKLGEKKLIEEVNIHFDLAYDGGFQLSVEAELVLGRTAYLSLKVRKFEGRARIEFQREPYTHWSFAFIGDPDIDFEVESQFAGRPIPQLATVIVKMIKWALHKKHTLPNFKIRTKPFFLRPVPLTPEIRCWGRQLSIGQMTVTLVRCSRLPKLSSDCHLYCSLSVDTQQWINCMAHLQTIIDVEVIKMPGNAIGLSFREDFLPERNGNGVVVGLVDPDSAASAANLQQNDVILAVNNVKVVNSFQAVRLMQSSGDRLVVRVARKENTKMVSSVPFDVKPLESKSGENAVAKIRDQSQKMNSDLAEEFVNINANGSGAEELVRINQTSSSTDKLDSSISRSPEKTARTISDQTGDITASIADDLSKIYQANEMDLDGLSTKTEDLRKIQRTHLVVANQNPDFGDKFEFDIEEKHKYLSVCLWARVPDKREKQTRILRSTKDVPLGQISIPLVDVAIDCLATLQGDTQMCLKFSPPHLKGGASRGKWTNLAIHSGFDEMSCYGDITLEIQHRPDSLTPEDRKELKKISLASSDSDKEIAESEGANHDLAETQLNSTNSVNLCLICSKKIWMKTALQCQVCLLVCHKKCADKCRAKTVCTSTGFKWKEGHVPVHVNRDSGVSTVDNTALDLADSKSSNVDEMGSNSSLSSSSITITTAESLNGVKLKRLEKPSLLSRIRSKGNKAKAVVVKKVSQKVSKGKPALEISYDATAGTIMDAEQLQDVTHALTNDLPQNVEQTSLQSDENLLPNKCISEHVISSGSEDEEFATFLQKYPRRRSSCDEAIMTAAKEKGKGLYANLDLNERREKLETLIDKYSEEVGNETNRRDEIFNSQQYAKDATQRKILQTQLEKCDAKIQSLTATMLFYCSGLQSCMDDIEQSKSPAENIADETITVQEEVNEGDDSNVIDVEDNTFPGHRQHTDTDLLEQDEQDNQLELRESQAEENKIEDINSYTSSLNFNPINSKNLIPFNMVPDGILQHNDASAGILINDNNNSTIVQSFLKQSYVPTASNEVTAPLYNSNMTGVTDVIDLTSNFPEKPSSDLEDAISVSSESSVKSNSSSSSKKSNLFSIGKRKSNDSKAVKHKHHHLIPLRLSNLIDGLRENNEDESTAVIGAVNKGAINTTLGHHDTFPLVDGGNTNEDNDSHVIFSRTTVKENK